MQSKKNSSGCLAVVAWPFLALWKVVTIIFQMVGRMVALIIGLLLMIVGALLAVTIVGAVVGVPLVLLGLLLIVRSLF